MIADSRRTWFTRPRFGRYSFLGMLNMLVLQWLCVRLQATMCTDGVYFDFIGPIVPMTGWWNDYIWVRR